MKITLGEIEVDVEGFWSEIVISPDGKQLKIAQPVPPPIQYIQVPTITNPWVYPGIGKTFPYVAPGITFPYYTTSTTTLANGGTQYSDGTSFQGGQTSGSNQNPIETSGFVQVVPEVEEQPVEKHASCQFNGSVSVMPIPGETMFGARVYSKPPVMQTATQSK
jgi:hypothetical protein